MTTIHAPARSELVHRAAELAPTLRRHAQWSEDNRRLHDEVIEALADAGIFRMRKPARYGGYEADARTMIDVATELGRGDGSAAWTSSVYWIPTYMAGLFPDAVQDEVFADADMRICGTLSPTGTAVPADGGYVLNGRWAFQTGALHASWQQFIAMSSTEDGTPYPVIGLVPMAQMQIIDDWHSSGLRGSGSVSTVAQDVFVPAERVMPLGALLREQYASKLNAGSAMFRTPLLPVASASSVGTAVGLARAGVATFLDRLPGRRITYTDYAQQSEAPVTHLAVADAALKADVAEFHAMRIADTIDRKSLTGEPWAVVERVRARADMGGVCRNAKEAVEMIAQVSGGTSVYQDAPIQRIARDVHAMTQHALMNPLTNLELYGRVLCGMRPNTMYL